MKPFTLFRAWLICALVWCCCSSLWTAQIYQNSFLYPSANHDHNSVAEAYTGGNTVQAGILFAAGINAAHFQEVDDAGNLVWESANEHLVVCCQCGIEEPEAGGLHLRKSD